MTLTSCAVVVMDSNAYARVVFVLRPVALVQTVFQIAQDNVKTRLASLLMIDPVSLPSRLLRWKWRTTVPLPPFPPLSLCLRALTPIADVETVALVSCHPLPYKRQARGHVAIDSPSLPDTTAPAFIVDLPPFKPVSTASFCWNTLLAVECTDAMNECYEKAVHWIPNLFSLPSGKQGRLFVKELSRLFYLYAEDSAMECIALKAAFLLPLLLQKPHRRSKNAALYCGRMGCLKIS